MLLWIVCTKRKRARKTSSRVNWFARMEEKYHVEYQLSGQNPKGWTILVGVVVLSLLLTACGSAKPKTYTVGMVIECP